MIFVLCIHGTISNVVDLYRLVIISLGSITLRIHLLDTFIPPQCNVYNNNYSILKMYGICVYHVNVLCDTVLPQGRALPWLYHVIQCQVDVTYQ